VVGELRYREFVPKKQKKQKNGDHKIRVAEIHLWRIASSTARKSAIPTSLCPSWLKLRVLPSRF
jgi:hypothetical protein